MRPAYALVVAAGPDEGKRFFFDDSLPARVLLGKSHVCHFALTDPEISRRHAAFEIDDHGLRIVDLDSTNGTRVGTIRVREAWLGGGSVVNLGATQLKVLELPVKGKAEPGHDRFGRMLGASTMMQRLHALCAKAAASSEPVLLEGETGTGKELLAECLHEQGSRAQAPFVVMDCTGAADIDVTMFDQASGGTLVLDEIGELEPAAQAKLLRALGSKTDVRIVATTQHDLDRLVQEGKMRDDLYWRVAILRIELPPLRTRVGDVPLLAEHFWRTLGGEGELPVDLRARLDTPSNWPGNVRELQNLVARRLALGELRVRGLQHDVAVDSIDRILDLELTLPESRERVTAEFERRFVERALAKHGGNVAKAAAASGVARRYFQLVKARQRGT